MRQGAVIIPDVPIGLAPGATDFLRAVKQALEVLQGTGKTGAEYMAATVAAMQGWTTVPVFSNSWANYGAPYGPAAYCKDALGFVRLRGVIKGGSINAAAFTLPAGFRPLQRLSFPGVSLSGATFVITKNDITSGGDVIVADASAGGNSALMLDGVSFYAG